MNRRIPKIAEKILQLILPENLRDYASGDFEEIYNSKYEKQGRIYAVLWCYYSILVNIPGYLFLSFKNGGAMFLTNLKISFRHLRRQKIFSVINITGLTLSLIATIFIWLWINDELNYDKFHKNIESLYTVEVKFGQADKETIWSATPQMLGEQLQKDFNEITEFVTLYKGYNYFLKVDEDVFKTENCVFSTPEIGKIFDIELTHGDISEALKNSESIVLSNQMAEKHFGKVNPVGKRITFNAKYDLLVTGVFTDLPKNSHLKIDYLIPLSLLTPSTDWGRFDFYTYLKIPHKKDINDLSSRMKNYLGKFTDTETELNLRSVSDIHLYTSYGKGNISNVYFFAVVGIIILIVGCINYVNLSTARSMQREKEIGIRKVVGAEKNDLVKQLFAESFLTTLVAFILTIVAVDLLLDIFNNLSGKELNIKDLFQPDILTGLFVIFLFTSFLAGIYPAFYISKFNPFKNLNAYALNGRGNSKIRKGLILVQFLAAVILITFALFVNQQISFIKGKKLGFDKEQVLCVQTNKLGQQLTSFKNEVNILQGVEKTSVASQIPVNMGNFTMIKNWEGLTKDKSVMFLVMGIDQNYLDLMGMKLSEGTNFSFHHNRNNIIVNETALKKTGLKNPLGKTLEYWIYEAEIQGVVKDFHNKSLRKNIEPVILYHDKGETGNYLFVKIKPESIEKTIAAIEKLYKDFSPSTPFNYSFIDDNLNRLYKSEMGFQKIVRYFSAITIITALMGLVGLTVFSVERKTKEIGIRKVLGASTFNIFKIISNEFMSLIIAACLLAIPVSYYLTSLWLENYSYKISIDVLTFLIVIIAITGAGYLTIILNAYRKINLNPVDSIKEE